MSEKMSCCTELITAVAAQKVLGDSINISSFLLFYLFKRSEIRRANMLARHFFYQQEIFLLGQIASFCRRICHRVPG